MLAEAVLFAELDPQAASYMISVIGQFGDLRMNDLTQDTINGTCAKVLPDASTDTWKRWIVVPLQRISRAGHGKERCTPILFPGFTPKERQAQDRKRCKKSRPRTTPGSRPWLGSFKTTEPHKLYVLARFMFETAARIGQAIEMNLELLARLEENVVIIPSDKGHDDAPRRVSPELADLLRSFTPKAPRGCDCFGNYRHRLPALTCPSLFAQSFLHAGAFLTIRQSCHAT